MKIEQSKNKVKIILEYLPKSLNFGSIYESDLNKLHLKIFLKSGEFIMGEEIKSITFAVKDDALVEQDAPKDIREYVLGKGKLPDEEQIKKEIDKDYDTKK